MKRLTVWLGTGVVALGVSVAMVPGAGVAAADSDSGAVGGATASESGYHDRGGVRRGPGTPAEGRAGSVTRPNKANRNPKDRATSDSGTAPSGNESDQPATSGNDTARRSRADRRSPDRMAERRERAKPRGLSQPHGPAKPDEVTNAGKRDPIGPRRHQTVEAGSPRRDPGGTAVDRLVTNRAVARDRVLHWLAAPDALSQALSHPLSDTARSGRPLAVATPDLQSVVVQGASFMGKAAAASGAAAAPTTPSLVGLITSVVFSMFSGLERLVTGPPRVPPNSTVTVHSSTLQITDDLGVPADWYYPAGDDPPGRLILLQHGFVTIGPMYSYTAANLAEDTHSIVVAPTLTSNPFADGGLWLWGDGMSRAVAGLFTEDRAALTQSALAAGYAQQYGLDPDTATLPRQFALVGHSAGGAAVSGTAGYLAENGAAADLAGVILLDGVPFGDVLPGALTRLDTYEQATDIYIPVRQIAAPWSIWNFLSNANESLSQARPGRFNGVVLTGGVHSDSVQAANQWTQFVLYVVAGFPQPQNPLAVRELSAAWLNDWFEGRTDLDDDLLPGSMVTIDTPAGPATGTVIGAAPAVTPAAPLLTGGSAALPLSA